MKLRQLELQLRSAELRVQLAQDARALEQPLQWADHARRVWRLMGSLPKAWKALGALGGMGGLIGLFRLGRIFGKPGRLARLWTWLAVARRVWRWVRPKPASAPPDPRATGSATD
ncbi:hypothetical protein CDN98_21555 [Roseateles terrae]|nr:hypothetical protein CDN98_21555 [Roseateles terrae]